jgi:hypothetical protein
LLYKVIASRHEKRSTVLITNVDFDAWSHYLGDPPLAMAMLDRLVDGALVLKITGRSYRHPIRTRHHARDILNHIPMWPLRNRHMDHFSPPKWTSPKPAATGAPGLHR